MPRRTVLFALILAAGCSPAADRCATAEDAAPGPAAGTPARTAAPGLDVDMGDARAPIGRPRPAVNYHETTAFGDSTVYRHSTADFKDFEGFPVSNVDVYEELGGPVFRTHVYVDTSAVGSPEALLARLEALYGPGVPYRTWKGWSAHRFTGRVIELRYIQHTGPQSIGKLVFARVGAGEDYDDT